MIIVANRISVKPEYAEAFEQRFRERAGLVDGMEGFVKFQILRPTAEGDPYIVQTYWETHENFTAWTESDEFKQGHGRSGSLPQEAFLGRPKLEIHEIMDVSESVSE
ncbi:MAG: antibiotic biosynthesis monooxygenase [Anaerolineae bacterium]|nr:antibiotic biosynthesis monooxygenase [Anaerolineae bacterium]